MEIGVVIVTYNRLEKLKIALRSFREQTYKPAYIIVVNNASTDGTGAYLERWSCENKKHLVINNNINNGGSGGFYDGLNKAISLSADWIWLSDDDAYPEKEALCKIATFIDDCEGQNISAVCTAVKNKGEYDFSHRRNIKCDWFGCHEINSTKDDYNKDCFAINAFSYVGAVVSKKYLKMAGLTKKDFFIHYDDTEHSLRLSKYGKIYCIPSSIVHHDVTTASVSNGISWKNYYGIRNKLITYKEHMPINGYIIFLCHQVIRAIYKLVFCRDKKWFFLIITALKDGLNKCSGIHSIYRPGWK